MSESSSRADFLRGASITAKTSISLQNLDPLPLLETYSFLVLALLGSVCLIAINDSCNKGISQAGNFLWARIFITVSLALWIIPLAQAPALTRSAKLNAEICACSIFNSRSWAAYQSCDCSLSSVLKWDYHDYTGKNVGGTKQGPNRS